ncbi:hypothetical protein FACS189461_4100 [Spirochaetia bacterium]|nr:hypothetical protein FACS189461_4100 [Spirochaetia bacterium]
MLDDDSCNTINLIHNAQFEVLISNDLFWVPVNRLGNTRYKNGDIKKLAPLNPAEKKTMVTNAYEAVQLFQIGQFEDREDVLYMEYNGKEWEHHKPGYYAVLDNYGCCSSIAAWFDYLLGDIYQDRGYIMFSRPDGSGHVMNYVFFDNAYYILDLTAMTYEKAGDCCRETGIKKDYIRSKYATGCCFKTSSISSFVKFHSRIQLFHGFEFLYSKIPSCSYLPPLSVNVLPDKTIAITGPYHPDILNKAKNIIWRYEEGPNYSPAWN